MLGNYYLLIYFFVLFMFCFHLTVSCKSFFFFANRFHSSLVCHTTSVNKNERKTRRIENWRRKMKVNRIELNRKKDEERSDNNFAEWRSFFKFSTQNNRYLHKLKRTAVKIIFFTDNLTQNTALRWKFPPCMDMQCQQWHAMYTCLTSELIILNRGTNLSQINWSF